MGEPDCKYIITKRWGTTKLTRQSDGFYHSEDGTIYAFKDGITLDEADRCGIYPFALPTWPFFQKVNEACRPHDFMYSSPVWQAFHTRQESDLILNHLQAAIGHPVLGEIFEELARFFGAGAWENPLTNN